MSKYFFLRISGGGALTTSAPSCVRPWHHLRWPIVNFSKCDVRSCAIAELLTVSMHRNHRSLKPVPLKPVPSFLVLTVRQVRTNSRPHSNQGQRPSLTDVAAVTWINGRDASRRQNVNKSNCCREPHLRDDDLRTLHAAVNTCTTEQYIGWSDVTVTQGVI